MHGYSHFTIYLLDVFHAARGRHRYHLTNHNICFERVITFGAILSARLKFEKVG